MNLFHALIASLVIANLILVVLNLPLAGVWAMLLAVPFRKLAPMIVVISLIGVWSVQGSTFHIWIMLTFGAVGWGLSRIGLDPTPLALGFILGPSFEEYLRRTLLFSRGDPVVLVQDPVSLGCLLIMAMASLWLTAQTIRQGRAKR